MYTIYGMENCGWCVRAKDLLTEHNLPFEYHDVQVDIEQQTIMLALHPETDTLPQIFLDGTHIGGYTELAKSFVTGSTV